jgi:hypothetical protein
MADVYEVRAYRDAWIVFADALPVLSCERKSIALATITTALGLLKVGDWQGSVKPLAA